MNIDDETLMAYADDELDAPTRARVEAAIAQDPALAVRVQEHRALRAQLNAAFDPVLDERVPERLTTAIHAPAQPAPAPIDLARVREQRAGRRPTPWSWPQWSAIAASLLLGLIVGRIGMNGTAAVTTRNGELVAAGDLATALNDRLSSEANGTTRIAVSFRTKEGEYCRAFNHAGKQALAGVACRTGDEWRVRAVTTASQESSEYRMASSPMPPAVRAVVEETMQGEPLSVEAESAARHSGWQ